MLLSNRKSASAPASRRPQATVPQLDVASQGPRSVAEEDSTHALSRTSPRKRKYEALVDDREEAEDDSDPLPPMRKSARLARSLESSQGRALQNTEPHKTGHLQVNRRNQTLGISPSRSHSNRQAPSDDADDGTPKKPQSHGSTTIAAAIEDPPQLEPQQEGSYDQEEANLDIRRKGLNAGLEMTATPWRGKRRFEEPEANDEVENAHRRKFLKSNDGKHLPRPPAASATSPDEDTEPMLQAENIRTRVGISAMDRDPSRVAVTRDKLPAVPPSAKLSVAIRAESPTAELVQEFDAQGNNCHSSLLVDELEDGTLNKQEVQLLEDRVKLPQPLEPHAIRGIMERICTRVKTSVDSVLRALRVSGHHPVYMDPELQYPKDYLGLLSTVLGCDVRFVQLDAQEFFSSQTQRHVNLYVFLQALLGAAVRDWCLKPCPQGDDFWTKHKWLLNSVEMCKFEISSELWLVPRLILRDFGPYAAERVKHHHLQQYIIDTIEPQIEKKAETMASNFDRLLQFLLPQPATFHKDAIVDNVDSYGPADANRAADWHREWMESLRAIFTAALRWRAQAEKNGNGEVEFRFPNYGQVFQSDSQDASESENQVLLALMPTVRMKVKQSMYRDIIEDGWYEVYNGVVYADKSMAEQHRGHDVLAAA